jgi:3-methyladenine DNA glycosylase AlkD
MLKNLIVDLQKLKNPKQAQNLSWFFKTGKGQYGEGDVFLGIKVPEQRKLVNKYYKEITFPEVQKLLNDKIHEYRLVGLLILVAQYEKADPKAKEAILKFYLRNTKNINNWDLVDLSAYKIVGNYLLDKDRKILYTLAKSKNLWEKRIGIISTFAFIRVNQFQDTLKIAEILLPDKHDLIHKAVGWMLREVGKRDQKTEEEFLDEYGTQMPRTMLRYAIEKFEESLRQSYLKK